MSSKRVENGSKIPRKQNGDIEGKKDSVGIRYITEDLICKISKQNSIEHVTNLNLKLSAEGGKKFRYIENLEKCKRLQVLSLSCNVIEKIEKLDKLTRLRELDLSYNCLEKIEGLETLTSLTHLNVTGNKIPNVPLWLPKKLKALKVFKLARNDILSLHEVTKLRALKDLTQLTIAENPVATLPHCRLYLVFHLRTLDTIDAQKVDWEERTEAQARFAQEELETLQKQLDAKEAELHKLGEAQNKSLGEIEEGVKTSGVQKEKLKSMNERIKELQQVLTAKDDLLKRKTKELTKACEKHYELEQELAFYKIDHKFEQLGKPPTPQSNNNSQEDSFIGDMGLIGESPYIGRGRFHKEKMADGSFVSSRQTPQTSHAHSDRSGLLDDDTRIKMHEALDRELEDKKKSIDRAQDRLQHLNKEVETVETQLTLATKELKRLQDTQPRSHLTEDDKHVMRSKLAKKISKVHHLRSEADRLGSEMENTQDHIQHQERNISEIRGQLRRMGSQHQLYPQIQREVADKETQLELTNQQYQDLVGRLEDVLATIAKETTDIQQLEHQLREGQINQNEEMKEELEGIIGGLQSYLHDVQQKSAEQKEDFNALLGDREELQRQLEELLDENDQLRVTRDHLTELQDRMVSLEESLEDAKEENRSLHHQLGESRVREVEDAEMSIHLRDAEQEILRLQKAVEETDRKLQAEKAAADAKIEAERVLAHQLAGRARDASDAEDEVQNLQQQLAQLQAVNSEIQDQLYKTQHKKDKADGKLIDPRELKHRLDNFRKAVRSGQKPDRGSNKDALSQALCDLQDDLQGQLDQSHHDLEEAHQAAAKAQKEVAAYRKQLEQKEAQLGEERRRQRHLEGKSRRDVNPEVRKREKSSQIDLEREEMERLRRELANLRAELEREKEAAVKNVPIPSRLLEPSQKQTTSGTSSAYKPSEVLSIVSTSSGEIESIPSSHWSRRRSQLYEGMTPEEQDLFDELQREMEELRKLLAKKKNKQAVDKMTQAEMTANRLMELMSDRHRQTETDSMGGRRPSTNYPRKSNASKSAYVDQRLEKTARDLEQAQYEMEDLRAKLKERRSQLKHEVKHSDKVQDIVGDQKDEIDRLHLVLDEQRDEIGKLRNRLDYLTTHPQDKTKDHITAYDAELQELQDSAATLRDTLASHGPRIQRLGDGRRADGYDQNRYGPLGRDELDGGYGPYPQDNYGHRHQYNSQAHQRLSDQLPHPTNYSVHPQPHSTFAHATQQSSSHPYANQVPGHTHQIPGHAHSTLGPAHQVQSHSHHLPNGVQYNAYSQINGQQQQPGIIPSSNIPITNYGGAAVFQSSSGHVLEQAPRSEFIDGAQANPASSGVAFQNLPQHAIITQLPTTPTKHTVGFSQPTTPIAGSVLGPSIFALTTTPSQVNTVPVMVSTPLEDTSASLKGILKKDNHGDDDSEEHLICNVPEHHDLEDYIAKLQEKIKALKMKLKAKQATKQTKGDGQRVLFEDDVERRAIKHLHAELQARRGELEGLDLAIERQKSSLRTMKETEKFLLSEREAAKKELRDLKKHRTKDEGRKAFLDGQAEYDIYDSDYDYDYVPTRKPFNGARVTYLQEEIACLEKTLADRRAELREADRLLEECNEEVEITKAQTKSTLAKYQEAKSNFHQTLKDAELLDSRARETGQDLVKGRDQLGELMKEVAALQMLRQKNQDMLKAIEEVISSRDHEFQIIDRKLKEAKATFEDRQKLIAQMPSSQGTLQGASDKDLRFHQEELDEVQETLQRRQVQLDGLERQLDRELGRGKREVDDLQTRSDILKAEQAQFDDLLKVKQDQLQKVQDEIDREEAVLQDLATTTNKQRSDLHILNTDIQVKQTEMQSLKNKLSQRVKELDTLKHRFSEEESTLKKTRAERLHAVRDLEEIKVKVSDVKDELDSLENQQQILEGTLEALRGDKKTLEELNKAVEKKIVQLQRSETRLNNTVKDAEGKLNMLENNIKEAECDIEGLQNERSVTHSELLSMKTQVQERKTEMEMIINEINEAENQMALVQQREAERRQLTEEKITNLEKRMHDMGHEINKRTEEKEMLVDALSRSGDEIQNLRHNLSKERDEQQQKIRNLEGDMELLKTQLEDRSKEVMQVREKSSQEIADLENIAQAHYSRANRLSDELNYLQAEFLDLKHRMKSQEELEDKEKILQEAIEQMRADIKQELAGSLGDLELSHMESLSELQRMQGRSDQLQECLHQLRQSLKMINMKNTQPTLDTSQSRSSQGVENEFAKQQSFLMAQVRDKVSKHADNFASQKQLSQENIRKLKVKLTDLEKVFAYNDSTLTLNEGHAGQVRSGDLEMGGSLPISSQGLNLETTLKTKRSPSPKRAYSPNRHSQTRQRTFSGSQIPEKDYSS